MNRATYACKRPQRIVYRMARFPCEYYYLQGDRFEVVCGYKWHQRQRLFRLMSVGFVGAISPQDALDLVVQNFCRFLFEKRIDHVAAIRPDVMENPAIVEFYKLAQQHPSVRIRGTHHRRGGAYWWIQATDKCPGPA